MMKFGLCAINIDTCANPDYLTRVAQLAEAAGFESLWTIEHVVLPDPRKPPSPMEPSDPIIEPFAALSFVAAITKTIRLSTGITIVPQHNPLILAKLVASLDVLSQGRVIFGVGVGYLDAEFAALGAPFNDRGTRANEYIEAMRVLWTQEKPAFKGKFVSFSNIQARPLPVQRPHPPIVVGGYSGPAFRRALRIGNGWYGYGMALEETIDVLGRLRQEAAYYQRPTHLGELEITITPDGMVDSDLAKRYAALGVHRLNLELPTDPSFDALERFFENIHRTMIGKI